VRYEPISCAPETAGTDIRVNIFRVVYRDETGDIHGHVFPTDTLAWRAHEYGIDPADVDTLLHMVLHERWTDEADDVDIYAMQPDVAHAHHRRRLAKAATVATVDHRHPVFAELRRIHTAIAANDAGMAARREAVHAHRRQRGVHHGRPVEGEAT
jgi:hypothetical protein